MTGHFTFWPSFFFFFLVIGVIEFFLLWVGLGKHLLVWAGLVFVMAVLNFILKKNLILCFYIYILVIGNIMNKSLFMQVEIAKNLLLFDETTIILFI